MNYRVINILVSVALALTATQAFAKKDKEKGKSLPPGLQKKLDRGDKLPPGWEKKLKKGDVLDKEVYSQARVVVPLGKDGAITVNIDGRLLKLREKTREIIDILN